MTKINKCSWKDGAGGWRGADLTHTCATFVVLGSGQGTG